MKRKLFTPRVYICYMVMCEKQKTMVTLLEENSFCFLDGLVQRLHETLMA